MRILKSVLKHRLQERTLRDFDTVLSWMGPKTLHFCQGLGGADAVVHGAHSCHWSKGAQKFDDLCHQKITEASSQPGFLFATATMEGQTKTEEED